MNKIIILTVIITITLKQFMLFGQCTNQVLNTFGTSIVNGINVTVTSTGIVDRNTNYCNATKPYFVGYNYTTNMSGYGSYNFNFSPPISSATLNFSGITNYGNYIEEIQLFVNGIHYKIPSVGSLNGCDSLAELTALGNIRGCLGCGVSGWNGTSINGLIFSITVIDSISNQSYGPLGSIFSLFICDSISTSIDKNEIITNYQLFPNPFSTQTNFKTDKFLKNATLTVFNYFGQIVKEIKNISGQTFTLNRENLSSGLYFFRLTDENKIFSEEKLVITD